MDDLQALVAAEYTRLHDALRTLPEPRWDEPSLCAGWTVRHVVAHLTTPARYSPEDFGAELAAAGHDFTALNNRIADRDAGLAVADLLAALAEDRLARFTTPAGGVAGALSHVVIHGLDVTVPLGLGCVAEDASVGAVLELLVDGGVHAHFGTDLADDPVDAPAYERVLVLAGRETPAS